MQLTVTGKQVEVGDALRRHVERSLDGLLDKYFGSAIEAHAVFAREAHLIRAELTLHIGRNIAVHSSASAAEHHLAFDAAAERLAKQLRRHKRRLRDYHGKGRGGLDGADAVADAGEPDADLETTAGAFSEARTPARR